MKIKLKQLTLINFKGAVKQGLNFTDQSFVFGDNATGKTTIFDGFTWLLFGKDSDGRSGFQIKTLDANGVVIPQIYHEVEGVMEIDSKDTTFKRVLREKWVKKRGFEETVFDGNETIFFIDDVPLKASEYQSKISELINENLFKLITSPTAFNSIKWEERKKILIDIVGATNEDEIITSLDADTDQKQWLINLLSSDKTVVEQKKIIAAQIKREKDELKMIPTRIDEANRSKPEIPEEGFEYIKGTSLVVKQVTLNKLDTQIQDKSKAFDSIVEKANEKKRELYKLGAGIDKMEQLLKAESIRLTTPDNSELDKLTTEKRELTRQAEEIDTNIKRYESKDKLNRQTIASIDVQQDEKRKEWAAVNAEEFDSSNQNCPTCKQLFDKEKLTELELTFSGSKKTRLQSITDSGVEFKTQKDLLFGEIESNSKLKDSDNEWLSKLNESLKVINNKIEKANSEDQKPTETAENVYVKLVFDNEGLKNLTDKHTAVEKEIKELEASMINPDTEALKEKRQTILTEIDELKAILLKESTIKQIDGRVEDLKRQETTLAQSIANVERNLFLIDKYNKASIETIEGKINDRFDLVKFKMFEQQINGGESETCICMVGGVPYSDLNTAMKINAGLDIINTLSDHYNCYAPIFVDGRESIVKLIETKAQIINLVVSEEDKTLRVI